MIFPALFLYQFSDQTTHRVDFEKFHINDLKAEVVGRRSSFMLRSVDRFLTTST